MFRILLTATVLSLLFGAGYVATADTPKPAPATPKLETFKKLVGQWVQVGEDGKPTDRVMTEFRLTAGGSVVLETIMPGTENEMITMYYQDGDQLMLTHYCVMRNQPTMRASKESPAGSVHFEFISGTNMKVTDPHMHDASYKFVDDDHFIATWRSFTNGKVDHIGKFDVVRKKKAAGVR